MTKGWYEKKDPVLGKARRHSEVARKRGLRGTLRSPAKAKTSEPTWYQDTEISQITGKPYKVWRTVYRGFDATVYPVGKRMWTGAKGWEYELYREEPLAEYDSLSESSVGADHAKDAETAMKWAKNTIDEWED